MAETVSTQITDAVTQANVKVLGDAPAMAMSNLYQTMSQSLSLAAQNAVTSQQQSNIVHQAATTQGVSLLYSVDTAATAAATSKSLEADTAGLLANILAVVTALKDSNTTS
ncbi:MAG: RebB family R body protein [Crocosphaera sp.]|nr:RebB family R body protein [Crocosphaera sp.]